MNKNLNSIRSKVVSYGLMRHGDIRSVHHFLESTSNSSTWKLCMAFPASFVLRSSLLLANSRQMMVHLFTRNLHFTKNLRGSTFHGKPDDIEANISQKGPSAKRKRGIGLGQVVEISAELAEILKFDHHHSDDQIQHVLKETLVHTEDGKKTVRYTISRKDIVKRIWVYIKFHDLQDKKDGRIINLDSKLYKLLIEYNQFQKGKIKAPNYYRPLEIPTRRNNDSPYQIDMFLLNSLLSTHIISPRKGRSRWVFNKMPLDEVRSLAIEKGINIYRPESPSKDKEGSSARQYKTKLDISILLEEKDKEEEI